jgi:hypothetical protein
MAKLSCNAENCVNNVTGAFCTAGVIHIKGNNAHSSQGTICSTFAEKNFKNAVISMTNTNYTGELMQVFSSNDIVVNPGIKCGAEKCVYNENQNCNAPNVLINGEHSVSQLSTQCETFIER